jgi:hypothetical protein
MLEEPEKRVANDTIKLMIYIPRADHKVQMEILGTR